jgi:putative transposase
MPWSVTSPMYERQRFVLDAEHTSAVFAELCRRYGISRKTGYKWLDRYTRLGPDSLADRSHRPDGYLHATSPAVRRDPPAPPSLALGRSQTPRAPGGGASR